MILHRRYAYPLWWDLALIVREWALPLWFGVRLYLIDGSGRREYVARVEIQFFCLYWGVHYAWGKRRYHHPLERVHSLREVLERDLAWRPPPGPAEEMDHAQDQ
jgi:hypothetical protein